MPAHFRTPAATPPSGAVRRVFVSYSSHDLADIETFLTHLEPLKQRRGLEVYLERRQIVAGDSWDSRIMAAVGDCDLFLFFVSPHSLASVYCAKELATALDRHARGQCAIVPILLEHVEWKALEQPGPGGRSLASIASLPTGQRFVNDQWEHLRNALWAEVVEGLETALTVRLSPLAPAIAAPAPGRRLEPKFLPYLCDQTACEDHIHHTLKSWPDRPQALVLLLRAPPHACPLKFVERIETRRLDKLLRTLPPGCELEHDYGLRWPDEAPIDADTPKRLREFFLDQIKDSIGQPYLLDDQLAAALAAGRLHRLYVAELRRMSAAWFQASAQAFSRALRELARDIAPLRLVALLWSEDAEIQALEPTSRQLRGDEDGVIADVPPRLDHFGIGKVREWSRTNDVRDFADLSDEELEEALADLPSDRITMKDFARRIGPVLLRHG